MAATVVSKASEVALRLAVSGYDALVLLFLGGFDCQQGEMKRMAKGNDKNESIAVSDASCVAQS